MALADAVATKGVSWVAPPAKVRRRATARSPAAIPQRLPGSPRTGAPNAPRAGSATGQTMGAAPGHGSGGGPTMTAYDAGACGCSAPSSGASQPARSRSRCQYRAKAAGVPGAASGQAPVGGQGTAALGSPVRS